MNGGYLTTLATLPNLPAGNYVAFAKISFEDDESSSSWAWADCFLYTSDIYNDSDEAETNMQTKDQDSSLALESVADYNSTGTMTLQCNNYGSAVYAQHAKIIAIPLSAAPTRYNE